MPVTIKDIAHALKISPATVSLAMNNSPIVNTETAKKVREMATLMGYTPNVYARSLARGRSGSIAYVVPELSDYYFATLVKLTANCAKVNGYDLSILISNRSLEEERRLVNKAVQQNAEAIIISPANTTLNGGEYIEWLETLKTPIVYAATRYRGTNPPCAMSDFYGSMRIITEHMLDRGREKTALLSALKGTYTYEIFENGYIAAMKARGLEQRIIHIDEVDYKSAYDITMSMTDLPEAFVCVSDYVALGVENALLRRGINVPGDVMVSGFGEAAYSLVSPVPLTTMHRDLNRVAQSLVELCQKLIDKPDSRPADIVVPCELLARASTALAPEKFSGDEKKY